MFDLRRKSKVYKRNHSTKLISAITMLICITVMEVYRMDPFAPPHFGHSDMGMSDDDDISIRTMHTYTSVAGDI